MICLLTLSLIKNLIKVQFAVRYDGSNVLADLLKFLQGWCFVLSQNNNSRRDCKRLDSYISVH